MSRRAIKAINWAAIAERVPEEQKQVFVAFKTKSDQYLRRMMANPESSPQLNWDYYKKNVTIPGLVEKFKKEYEALTVPYPADKYTSLIDSEEKQMLIDVEEYRKKSEKEIENINKSISTLKVMMPYAEMTMEEFVEHHPETHSGVVNNPSIWPHTPEMKEAEEASLKPPGQDHDH
ncbi:ATP synthase subunit d, mitochondrial-like [Vespa crabro]|uniref:ATP synthase subunit d, mitochondrial-like n=1 Tax=Vespa crabro TaxID=7445 RepID=UPI001F027066|nr:ATP synthase subunit d, mitochondrial-like [Vespa crabro]